MENASKALIIAGAILISILLISVGIIIMNAINDPVQQGAGAAESQAIEMFNSKFITYEGDQKGSSLKTLASSINASNGTNEDHTITLVSATDDIKKMSEINASKTYVIEVMYAEKKMKGEAADVVKTPDNQAVKAKLAGPANAKSEIGYIYGLCITAVK